MATSVSADSSRGQPPNLDGHRDGGKCSFVVGVISLVSAVAMLVLATLFAAGVWGKVGAGFTAGGLSIGSMMAFGAAVVCLVPREEEFL